MGSYLANFTVYAMAMTGLIFFAVFIYKKVMNGGFHSNKSNFLSIEETMNINPRKSRRYQYLRPTRTCNP